MEKRIIKEHPILFSGPLVRAILADQKTQTRRLISGRALAMIERDSHELLPCPYGQPGDRIWVRETWRPEPACSLPGGWALRTAPGDVEDDGAEVAVRYHADSTIRFAGEPTGEWQWPKALTPYQWGGKETRWMPSILMPRWASRISLEVTEVRVQRVQEITMEDARAEGLPDGWHDGGKDLFSVAPDSAGGSQWYLNAKIRFEFLWKETHGRESWGANPWVWAVSFRRVL